MKLVCKRITKYFGYKQWRSINELIERAKVACKESQSNIDYHFAVQRKMVDIGSKRQRKVIDYKLSRFACYLIPQNGNIFYQLLKRLKLCVFKATTLIPILV